MNQLTPEEREQYKREICEIIDRDESAFFFCGTRRFSDDHTKVLYVFTGDSEQIVRALANEAHEDVVKQRNINMLLQAISHVLRLTWGILTEHVKIRKRNINPN